MEKLNMEVVRDLLEEETMCAIQHTGYPCNSCFHTMDIKLKEDIHEYWLAVLYYRGDYDDFDWEAEHPNTDTSKFLDRIYELVAVLIAR